MKKLILFSTICVLISIVFSSCNSTFEITKRRYNKGYYIDRSGNKDMALIIKGKAAADRIKAPAYPPQTSGDQKPKVSGSTLMPTQDNVASPNKAEKQGHKTIVATNTRLMMNRLAKATTVPSVQTASALSGLNNITDDDHHSHRDALSLFWLIILIILIVWVIGLIAGGWGLGGFINLLLLIALILLILWLLRII
jgi:hypothetical protein